MAFIDGLEDLIEYKLREGFIGESLSGTKIVEVYKCITDTVFDVFNKCEFTLDELSKKFIAQEMFKCLNINNDNEFRHTVIMREIKPKELSTTDLRLLERLFVTSTFHDKIKTELTNRT